MKQLLFCLAVLAALTFTPSSASANHAPSYVDQDLPTDLWVDGAGEEVLLAQRCYRAPRYYGPRSYRPSYYSRGYRGLGPYGYGAGYRGYGGYGAYSSRYGFGPRRGFGLYIGF